MRSDSPLGQAALRFMAERIWGEERPLTPGEMLIVHDDLTPLGVALFHNYDPRAGVIEVTAAASSRRWLTRPVLLELFSYPFRQLGCQAVVMRCDPQDKALGRILTAYGFTRHEIPRLRGKDKAEAIFVLGDDDWKANGFHKENRHG